jgi:hypothetical protein
VSTVINTIDNFRQQADFGMPASERVRVASLRALPMTTGATASASGHKCARMASTTVTAYTRVITDLAVVKGAFPGTSAWSPPRR